MSKIVNTYLDEWIDEHGFLNGIYVPWFQGKWYARDIGPNTIRNLMKYYLKTFKWNQEQDNLLKTWLIH